MSWTTATSPTRIVTAAATSADANYNGVNAADVAVTNTDNDASGITVTPISGLTTTEAGGTATFTVVLTTQPTADVTIGLSSSDTTEGTVSGEPHLHDRQLEHRADRDRDRRQRRPGRRRRRLHDRHRGGDQRRRDLQRRSTPPTSRSPTPTTTPRASP